MKKILLTGAAGTVGHHVLRQLLESKNKYDVTVLEIRNKKNIKTLKAYENNVKIIWGSITDKDIVNQCVNNQDVVIHLAGLIPPFADNHPELTREINFFGTKNIVDAIKEGNKDCFLMFSSSISIYGDRVNNYLIKVSSKLHISEGDYYALVKREVEEMIKESGINYTIFRLIAIMDNPKPDPLMFHMPLNTRLEIATARDTARAFVNGIEHQSELNRKIFNLGGGIKCRTTYRDFLKKMFDIYGLNYKYLNELAFAEKNFHCGYYEDSYILNDILHFQQDDIDSYLVYVKKHTGKFKKLITRMFSSLILFNLNKKSEPLQAKKKNIISKISRYFK